MQSEDPKALLGSINATLRQMNTARMNDLPLVLKTEYGAKWYLPELINDRVAMMTPPSNSVTPPMSRQGSHRLQVRATVLSIPLTEIEYGGSGSSGS